MTTRSGPDSGIRSATRVLRALRAIGATPSGLTAAELAAELGLGQATTYRLLATLQESDYVGRQSGEHRYILGRAVDELGRAVQSQLVVTPPVRAALRAVHDDAHAPAYLTVFRGDDIAVAHIEDSLAHPQITQLHVGFSEASHLTAFGKLMLASKDETQLARYLQRHGLVSLTHDSVTDAGALREQLDDVRAQQLAVELEEYLPKLACIAAPVRNVSGRLVGAVSVSVQAKDFNANAYALERAVRRGAWQVSSVIG
jgi:DNA-binding IclR family transcriptional regulator